jgi:hypothetical protein
VAVAIKAVSASQQIKFEAWTRGLSSPRVGRFERAPAVIRVAIGPRALASLNRRSRSPPEFSASVSVRVARAASGQKSRRTIEGDSVEAAVARSSVASPVMPVGEPLSAPRCRIHAPRPDTWLIRFFSGRAILITRVRDGIDQAVERLFQDRQRDPCALGLLINCNRLDAEILDVVEDTLAGALEISERVAQSSIPAKCSIASSPASAALRPAPGAPPRRA